MSSKILINAVDSDECRIAKVTDGRLEEFNIETTAREITRGNIYKGIVSRVEPGLQALFVDYGAERNGFLQKQEVHPDYFQDDPSGEQRFKTILRKGQELIVQITNDPIMEKGSQLTTFISLPGRHLVLMPGSRTIGVSRKIEDEAERKRLKDIAAKLKIPEGFGLIIRTAGAGATKTAMSKDFQALMRLWKSIKQKAIKESPPCLLYKDKSLAVRSIRDSLSTDVTEVLIDDDAVFQEVREFVKLVSPQQAKRIKRYQSDKPIFTKHQLEDQIASIFENRVNLKSGGSIVIEQTEALVSIDVNSGRSTKKKSIEETALSTNLEAAEEVARQLRLRDFGGLIVIDFIDMRDRKNKARVEQVLKANLKPDRARTKVGRLSRFGLLEMSRQRINPSIRTLNFENCRYCRGKGVVQSVESQGLSFLRRLRLETLKNGITTVRGRLSPDVSNYLLNRKKRELLDLEIRRKISVNIESDPSLLSGESRIEYE